MKNRILTSNAMSILVFAATQQVSGGNYGTVQAKDELNCISYAFIQIIRERTIEPTIYYPAGCVLNKGKRVPVGPMDANKVLTLLMHQQKKW